MKKVHLCCVLSCFTSHQREVNSRRVCAFSVFYVLGFVSVPIWLFACTKLDCCP
ncbi:hypothetical protein HanHA300_Chr09g0300621 [Helianthus annuus]|nr:hypothetical protein HanHA300_Chr09g0300621 [Helianthus annuus]KAJ0540658.1 hypothetical protein HanHA89_Chr09g0319291 [Helianthus annuus]KAJ0705806.1 hypothetical protein HanLR1_Chr09g0299541 [Helianthus annuus]